MSVDDHEVRIALLEKGARDMEKTMNSLDHELKVLNIKMSELIMRATVSKRFFLSFVTLVGIVWPIIVFVLKDKI